MHPSVKSPYKGCRVWTWQSSHGCTQSNIFNEAISTNNKATKLQNTREPWCRNGLQREDLDTVDADLDGEQELLGGEFSENEDHYKESDNEIEEGQITSEDEEMDIMDDP